MPLLKSNQPAQQIKPKPMSQRARVEFAEVEAQKVVMVRWPEARRSEGIGLSLRDGINLGAGIAIGMLVVFPIIVISTLCLIMVFWSSIAEMIR